MFSTPRLIFDCTEGVGSRFHVLRARNRFRLYRGRRDPFSCFALPDSFSTVPRASGPVFMFCAHGLIFGGTEGVGSLFHVLRSRTRFRRCRVHPVPLSCFALPESLSAVVRASGPVFIFCALGILIGGSEGVGSHFHVLASGLVFGGSEGVGSRFHVLCSRTRFRRCRVRQVHFHVLHARTRFRRCRGRKVPF
jgi:hypothetical protein